MSKIEFSVDEKKLIDVELPAATATYTPVSHQMLIEKSTELAESIGFSAKDLEKIYYNDNNGNEVSALYHLGDHNMDHKILMFQNSYNKRMAVKFAFGAVMDGRRIVDADISFRRKHTGSVNEELEIVMTEAQAYLSDNLDNIKRNADVMKVIEVGPEYSSMLAGKFFFEKEIINSSQAMDAKRALKKAFPKDAGGNYKVETVPLWDVYKIISDALRGSHASRLIEGYTTLFNTIKQDFGLI